MPLPVSLLEFIGEMEVGTEETRSYINKTTGEIELITMEALSAVEAEPEEEWANEPDWMQEMLQTAKEILSSSDWIELPDKWETHDYEIMRDYCYSVENPRIQDDLFDAIGGRGAFRRFKDIADHYDLLDDWYAFKQEAYKQIAIDWLERHEIPYLDDVPARKAKAQQPAKTGHGAKPAATPAMPVSVLGIPNDENSSFLCGSAGAPARIRAAFHSPSTNTSTESGIDLGQHTGWQDAGDIDFNDGSDAFALIEQRVGALLEAGHKVLSLGGDHAITYPIVRAFASKYPRLHILHLDAHPDLYDELDGNRHSHACPFARIMEAGLAQRLVQVGIRTMNPHQQAQAQRFGVEVIDLRSWNPARRFEFTEPLYISLDMDVLDPAFAPGISHYEPGGLSTREVLTLLQGVQANIVGADIVEYNPERDLQGMTAMVAAKLMKELLARMMD